LNLVIPGALNANSCGRRDDARAALGQQPNGRGSDDTGRAGNDGEPAIQTNSIGHGVLVSFRLIRLSRILLGSAGGARTLIGTDYFIRNTG
jgi:hypothetical protein